jgi:hypothetical protein
MNENAAVEIISGSEKPDIDNDTSLIEIGHAPMPIADPNFFKRLLDHVRVMERKFDVMSADEQRDHGTKYQAGMIRHARKAIVYGTYFGVALRAQFKGKSEQEQEKECERYNIHISSARRYIRLVDNLEFIISEAENQHLDAEEMGLMQLLDLLPKKEGQGGRPKRNTTKNSSGSAKITGNECKKSQPTNDTHSVEPPPLKQPETMLLFFTKVAELLDGRYEQREEIDWDKEESMECQQVIFEIKKICDNWIKEVDDATQQS